MVETELNQSLYQSFNLHLVDPSWNEFFQEQIKQKYFTDLLTQVEEEYKNYRCCPIKSDIFRLFRVSSLPQIKVVVLGQDPYHQLDVADGIAFSTKKPGYIPPTLENIFLELSKDLDCAPPASSNLLPWVKEGVFLLNTALTVQLSKPLSHLELWKEFIYSLIKFLKNHNKNLVWVFWGTKAKLIKEECEIGDELSVISTHPSPFSANKVFSRSQTRFFGSRPFSKINSLLTSLGKEPINWSVIEKPKIA
jgi:uracil-DNA glycosylase